MQFNKDLCEHITDECVYVKYEDGLQKIDLADSVAEWLQRISEAVTLRPNLNGTTITIKAFPSTERVHVIYNLEEEEIECIRGFEEVGDLVGESTEVDITVSW